MIREINTKFGERGLMGRSCLNSLDYHVKRINKESRLMGDWFRDKASANLSSSVCKPTISRIRFPVPHQYPESSACFVPNFILCAYWERSKDHGIKLGGAQERARRYFRARVVWNGFKVRVFGKSVLPIFDKGIVAESSVSNVRRKITGSAWNPDYSYACTLYICI